MKRIICIAISLLLICPSVFCINAYATEKDNVSVSPFVNEAKEGLAEIPINSDPIEYVPVEDIELSEFNDEMYVKDTQNLSATVYPTNAADQTVQYSSSNTSVATINRSGKLTAVGRGSCRIYVKCGKFSKYYDLKVKIKTDSINVKSKYVFIKPGGQFDLETTVEPAGASQVLKFKSNDESVATINSDGIITARNPGSTAIMVSNEDISILVNVIVSVDSNGNISQGNTGTTNNNNKDIDALTKKIKESSNQKIVVSGKGIDKISSSALKELYGTEKILTVELDKYDISICGQDIINANNEVNTKLDLSSTSDGIFVKLNSDNKLPGTITITLKDLPENYEYFYLVDRQSNEYKRLNSLDQNSFEVSSDGEYFLSTRKMDRFNINIIWILIGVGAFLVLTLTYIFTKKSYWFW